MTDDSPEQTRRLVNRFYARVWNEWDDGAVDGMLADDFEWRGSLGVETRGRDGFRGYRDMVRAGASDFHQELIELICEPERAAARVRATGHHTGVLLGIPPTGRAFSYSLAAFFRCSGSELLAGWVLGDLDALRSQLG